VVIGRDDDYVAAGKPVCDYDDAVARKVLVDALAKDAMALLRVLHGRELDEAVTQAGKLLATLVGQDLDQGADGVFTIARRVAKDRVISTVDPQARHGHKTAAHGYDGYKAHVAIDPDSEVITATAVTAGNTGDAASAADLLAQDLPAVDPPTQDVPTQDVAGDGGGPADQASTEAGRQDTARGQAPLAVYGDAAYGAGGAAGEAGGGRRRHPDQGAASGRAGGPVPQGPVHHRAGCRDGDLPCRRHRPHPSCQGRRWYRGLRDGLRRLPVGCPVHDRQDRAHHQDRRLRRRADPGPGHPEGSGVASRVPGHPTQGRTETRALDAPPARRQAGPGPRSDQGWG
jgi:Transposase DDE domain